MRKGAALAAVGLGALAVRRYARWRKAMSAAAPELRTPLLVVSNIPFNKLTLPIVRYAMSRESDAGTGIRLSTHRVEDVDVDVDVLVLTPTDQRGRRPAVLWIHGGGFVAGTARFEAPWARRLVDALGAVVVSPEYRLAPENPFPAGLDDCMAALKWMVKHADELGIDTGRVAVCGASAGGGLAATVAQRAFDEGIALQVQGLVYPMIDDRTGLRHDLIGKGELTWSASSNKWAWTAYLGHEPRSSDAPEYAAAARRAVVAGLAPAWIGVGELDVFHDEDVAYAKRLQAAGVPCEIVTVPGMYHGADGINREAPSMHAFHASMVEFLRTYLDAAE